MKTGDRRDWLSKIYKPWRRASSDVALIDPTPVTKTNAFVDQRVREPCLIAHGLTGFKRERDSERGLEGFNPAQTVRSGSNTDCWGNAQQPAKR